MAAGGGTLFLATRTKDQPRQIGPGQLGIAAGGASFSYHYYDSLENGRPTLGIRALEWSCTAVGAKDERTGRPTPEAGGGGGDCWPTAGAAIS